MQANQEENIDDTFSQLSLQREMKNNEEFAQAQTNLKNIPRDDATETFGKKPVPESMGILADAVLHKILQTTEPTVESEGSDEGPAKEWVRKSQRLVRSKNVPHSSIQEIRQLKLARIQKSSKDTGKLEREKLERKIKAELESKIRSELLKEIKTAFENELKKEKTALENKLENEKTTEKSSRWSSPSFQSPFENPGNPIEGVNADGFESQYPIGCRVVAKKRWVFITKLDMTEPGTTMCMGRRIVVPKMGSHYFFMNGLRWEIEYKMENGIPVYRLWESSDPEHVTDWYIQKKCSKPFKTLFMKRIPGFEDTNTCRGLNMRLILAVESPAFQEILHKYWMPNCLKATKSTASTTVAFTTPVKSDPPSKKSKIARNLSMEFESVYDARKRAKTESQGPVSFTSIMKEEKIRFAEALGKEIVHSDTCTMRYLILRTVSSISVFRTLNEFKNIKEFIENTLKLIMNHLTTDILQFFDTIQLNNTKNKTVYQIWKESPPVEHSMSREIIRKLIIDKNVDSISARISEIL